MRTLAAFLFVASVAAAQDGLDKIRVGDRLQVTLRNGHQIRGRLALPRRIARQRLIFEKLGRKYAPVTVNYAKEKNLSLNVSLESPALGREATIAFPRALIRSVRSISPYSAQDMKRIHAAFERERNRANAAEARRSARDEKEVSDARASLDARQAAAGATKVAEAAAQAAGDLREALNFYGKFPPPEWGLGRLGTITTKGVLKQPITPQEREFSNKIALWMKADQFFKEQQRLKEEEAKKADGESP